MWICPFCGQEFKSTRQIHCCGDHTVKDLLETKSEHAQALFRHLADRYSQVSDVRFRATKTLIAMVGKKRIGYVSKMGKGFIEFVITLDKPYEDNLCFLRIVKIENTRGWAHVARVESPEDVNDEVLFYLKKAYDFSFE